MEAEPEAAGSGSIAFDPAAEYYDRTRALAPATQRKVVQLLCNELADSQPCLEVGIGTGRMALPLRAAGVRMAGIDLSRPMLRKLIENAGGRSPFPIAVGDAVRMPFDDSVFGAVLVCHVLHLIPQWRQAVSEMIRVVRPDALVLVDMGGDPDGWPSQLSRHFYDAAGTTTWRPGLRDPEPLDQLLGEAGFQMRLLPVVSELRTRTIGQRIDALEKGLFAGCWGLSDEARRRAGGATRRWAAQELGPIDRPRRVRHHVRWRAYRRRGPC
jgi:ubiquinone/menaquinone biosynthesis C-methylase UbiE